MYIKQLTLQNFRGAEDLPIQFDPHLNVLVGMNGAGKSSILDAAAILLSWMVNRIRSSQAAGRKISDQDIRNGESTANIEMTCHDGVRDFVWSLAKTRKGYSKKEAVSLLAPATELAKQYQAEDAEQSASLNLPLFAYYPVNRAVLDIPLRIKHQHNFDPLDAYDESLTSGASFRTFFEWFREREDLENENRKYADQLIKPEGYQFPDFQLDAVRHALERFMPEFSNLTVRRKPLRMEVEKDGYKLTVNQLSDGEKCLMAIVGDLARRMAIANPNPSLNEDPLSGKGIILIDEVDLHLHPKWQRILVPRLREVFPNCQFIISTHSPHVITHVKPEHLHLLKMEEGRLNLLPVTESYGKNVDRILEDIMGLETTRPDSVHNQLSQLYSLIQQGNLADALSHIVQLRDDIGEDPDLVKASVLIKRKELIGK